MESHDSYRVMADFVDEVDDNRFKEQLITTLNKPKPFSQFKFQIDTNGKFRQQWFDFRHQRMIDWVSNQIDEHNNLNKFRIENSDNREK